MNTPEARTLDIRVEEVSRDCRSSLITKPSCPIFEYDMCDIQLLTGVHPPAQ